MNRMAHCPPDLVQKMAQTLSTATPLLPQDQLEAFIRRYFNRRDRYLKLLEAYPAPLYILESSVLKERARQFKTAFDSVLPSVGFYYAVKCNNHPDVARVMLESGMGLDVSSGLELAMALSLNAQDIVFSGPGKTDAELDQAVAHAGRVVVLMDSFGELHRLKRAAAACKTMVRCGVRLSVNTHGLWRKFGIAPQDMPEFLDKARSCPYIRLVGLQFHSSWNLSPDPQAAFIQELGKQLENLPESFKAQIEFIDIGGGYWPEQGEWLLSLGTPEGKLLEALGSPPADCIRHRLPATPIKEFARQVGAAIHSHLLPIVQCRICLEPGRWICNDGMHLLISVVDKKDDDLVITDAGTNAVGWERFETDYCPVLNLTRPSLEERPCHILGSLCTPHDVWGYAYWGEAIHPGDILMIPDQGAYTYSLRQKFIKPLPRVVTI